MQELLDILAGFSEKQVLLIGDTILDIYVYGTAIGKSAETPTIVAREIETKWSLGGAFLVARNILELGARVDFVTLVGNDEEAEYVKGFTHANFRGIPISDPGRRTTVKKRYWVDGYKLLQFDTLDNRNIKEEVVRETMSYVEELIDRCDAVVIADNRHGFLSPDLIEQLVNCSAEAGKIQYIDSQMSQTSSDHKLYQGAAVICLNQREAEAIDSAYKIGESVESFDCLHRALGIENIVVKAGDRGSVALIHDQVWHTAALPVRAVDTCGAGDAFLAALCLAGLERPALSLRVANTWAGLSTTIHGTQPPAKSDLRKLITDFQGS